MSTIDFGRYALSSCAAVAALAGCGSLQQLHDMPVGAPNAVLQRSVPAPQAATRAFLYEGDCCGVLNNGGVEVYSPDQKRAVRIVNGASSPFAVAFDGTGALYVLNRFESITEYDRGKLRPSRRLRRIYGANALALDSGEPWMAKARKTRE